MITSDPPPDQPAPKAVIPGDPHPVSVNRKVSLRLFGLVLIGVGIGLLVYELASPLPKQQDLLREAMAEGRSGRLAGNLARYWASALLLILGGVFWKAGR